MGGFQFNSLHFTQPHFFLFKFISLFVLDWMTSHSGWIGWSNKHQMHSYALSVTHTAHTTGTSAGVLIGCTNYTLFNSSLPVSVRMALCDMHQHRISSPMISLVLYEIRCFSLYRTYSPISLKCLTLNDYVVRAVRERLSYCWRTTPSILILLHDLLFC